MKLLKMISITILLLILCNVKPINVNAEGTRKLEKCEKRTLINIFNKITQDKISVTTEIIANEYSNNLCDCSYYDCSVTGTYYKDRLVDFLNFADALFSYINIYGTDKLIEQSDENSRITEFEELINYCYIDDLDIDSYYECHVRNNCQKETTPGGGTDPKKVDCSGFIGEETLELIEEILNYIRIIAPLAVLIYSALDLARAVAGKYEGNEDALEIAKQKINKRVIAMLLLFFLPTILRLILVNIADDIKIPSDCIMIIKNMFLWR